MGIVVVGEAAKSLSVSVRAVFVVVVGADVVVTPSAQLRARSLMTTVLRRAVGEDWEKS